MSTFSSIVSTILRSGAPTLLTALALPPPFNLIASAVVTGVLNKFLPPDEAPAQKTPDGKPVMTPEQVQAVVEQNAANPDLMLELKKAELELKKYEMDTGLKFAELDEKDRESSRGFQKDSGVAQSVFHAGMVLVGIALSSLCLVIVGAFLLVYGAVSIPPESTSVAVAAFGLVGTVVGYLSSYSTSIVGFYWGSSQGSADKTQKITEAMQSFGDNLGQLAQTRQDAALALPAPILDTTNDNTDDVTPGIAAKPAPPGLVADLLPELTANHHHFPDAVSWALTLDGISIDGAAPVGTPGDPSTVKAIWTRYGGVIIVYARQYGVPIELVVATIATESHGDPNARRSEPTLNDESVGLMQTLVATARQALGRKDITGDHLLQPELSIQAGMAYIAQQRGNTHFDPPLVAAAYNAGSLRRDDAAANRWHLVCYPTGTGHHIDNFVAYFADAMRVSAQEGWGSAEGTPAFATCLNVHLHKGS